MYALRFYKYIINKGSINNYVDMKKLIGGQYTDENILDDSY